MPESPSLPEVFDVLVIGAGPTGMACAIEAQRAGFRSVLVDKGCLCNSLFHYPAHMTFFTTSELLEIGDIPFPSPNAKPTRNEALEYYRKVAMHYKLDVRPYQRVEAVSGEDLQLHRPHPRRLRPRTSLHHPQTRRRHRLLRPAQPHEHPRRRPAQGPPLLRRPASLLRTSMCSSSAAKTPPPSPRSSSGVTARASPSSIAAPPCSRHVKYWILPRHRKPHQERRNRRVLLDHRHRASIPTPSRSTRPQGPRVLPNDFVFAMTGYHPRL